MEQDNTHIKNFRKDNSLDRNFFLHNPVKECILILLRERAMKQVDLADKIGLTRQALNNYISGRWAIPTQIKIKIARALEVDSSVIWNLDSPQINQKNQEPELHPSGSTSLEDSNA